MDPIFMKTVKGNSAINVITCAHKKANAAMTAKTLRICLNNILFQALYHMIDVRKSLVAWIFDCICEKNSHAIFTILLTE